MSTHMEAPGRPEWDIETVARDLFAGNTMREATAIIWCEACSRVVHGLTGRAPFRNEVVLVASSVARARRVEDIVEALQGFWQASWPHHTGAEIWAVVRKHFDSAVWEMLLLNPRGCQAAVEDVAKVAMRVWEDQSWRG